MTRRIPQPAAQGDDEILDVVDAADRIVASATRAEVHSRGLLHRAVHVWAFDPSGRVFLQRRSLTKRQAPGRLDSSAAGHLASGEDYLATAVRELAEELGTMLPPHAFHLLGKAPPGDGLEFIQVFRIDHAGPFVLNPDEIIGGAWWVPRDLDAALGHAPDDFSRTFNRLWRALRAPDRT